MEHLAHAAATPTIIGWEAARRAWCGPGHAWKNENQVLFMDFQALKSRDDNVELTIYHGRLQLHKSYSLPSPWPCTHDRKGGDFVAY
jgi:hypothetical protein